ncbi:tumor protein p53-inducible nuclear protein 2 isoform X3 [Amia ocellicauda]|uniref:tumor protein p53-inducible nuclear protein 2 isoform X3 n=1 Tax=Amia ocellicauda TaxID=2972642 RepID=UPI003463C185
MFQRLTSLFFGEVEDVTTECKGPKPCVSDADEEGWLLVNLPGATPEASPMEDLLIEHPSMSVYVSTGNQSITEETASIVLQETSQRVEPMPSAARSVSGRPTRGSVSQVTALAKVTQVSRVQRAKARAERRQLSRSRIQRQNRLREGVPRHSGHTRGSFLHQPCQRHFNY